MAAMVLKLYIAVVAIAAAITSVFAALAGAPVHGPSVAALAAMCALLGLTEFLQVRHYNYRGHGSSLNLVEGVLAPIVVFATGAEAVLVCFIGMVIAETLRRPGAMKVAFNTAMWVLAAAAGSLVAHAVTGTDPSAPRELGAATVAVVVMALINQAALTIVLALAMSAARERQSSSMVLARAQALVVAGGASVVAGITMVSLYRWTPGLVLLGAVYVVGLDASGRAIANVRADGHRLQALQRATHGLAMSMDVAHAVPACLEATIDGFEVRAAELVLFGDADPLVYRCTADVRSARPSREPHPLAELLRDTVRPIRLPSSDHRVIELLYDANHERVLVAPLRRAGETIGLLLFYDRVGIEGFEEGELTVAAALASELVSFLERVDLLNAIEDERRKLTEILESTSDGILTIAADGTVTSWNAGLSAITGHAAADMVGTRHFGLLRPRDASGRDILIERWQEMFQSPAGLPPELQIVSADGQMIWLSCSYSRIAATEGQGEALVIVARNITQARELERLKDDFVAVVSHELRTPLVPIKGWAQTLINRGDRLSEDQRRTAVTSILAQAQKLESLVLNILEASRIEAGRGDGDGIADVAAVTMRIVEDTLAARPDRVVRVGPPAVPCEVRGSSVWVERAVSNLVANALKYSPDDEPVDVAVFTEGNDVVVSVTDRGPGIAADAHERIFERFERLEESRTQTGTGLGLYITRRLARAMGGDVTVSSVPGAGSTFVLRMPAAPVVRVPDQRSDDEAPAPVAAPARGRSARRDRTGTSSDGDVVNLR